jgi:hypothetical protein
MATEETTTPWWSNLIAIIVTAIVSIVGTYYAVKSAPATSSGTGVSFPRLVVDTISYIPHILLLFGVLADMFTLTGVYSIPSLIGLASIPLNFLFKYFWKGLYDLWATLQSLIRGQPAQQQGGDDAVPLFQGYNGCDVQGFSALRSEFAPQTLVVTATIFSYYMFDLIANRGVVKATATIVVFLTLYLLETMVIKNCNADSTEPNPIIKSIMAFAEGMLFGGSSYVIVQAYYPERLPSSALSPFPRRSRKDLTEKDGRLVDKDGVPYVMLPNGQAVPDLSSQESRTSAAAAAARELGTDMPAVAGSCPSSR